MRLAHQQMLSFRPQERIDFITAAFATVSRFADVENAVNTVPDVIGIEAIERNLLTST